MNAQEIVELYSTGQRDFSHVKLLQVCLTDAKLIGAKLIGAELVRADLRGADLTEAHLNQAKLNQANLADAAMIQACLIHADLSGADLSGANLTHADLSGADLSEAKLVVSQRKNEGFLEDDMPAKSSCLARNISSRSVLKSAAISNSSLALEKQLLMRLPMLEFC